jgi:hypothetical protein
MRTMGRTSGLSRAARRERRRRIYYVIYRWMLVLVGSVGVAWLVQGMLRGGVIVPIELPTTGIAIAAACAFAGDLMALVTACGMYVRGEVMGRGHMLSGFWKAWGTATPMFLAVFSYVVPDIGAPPPANLVTQAPVVVPPPAEVAPPRLGEPWLVVYSSQPAPPVIRPPLSTVPVFYRNNAAPETAKLTRSSLVPGVSFAREELDVSIDGLQRIVAALASCGSVPDGPVTELEVAGYASSKEFVDPAGTPQADTDVRNARIANRRARAAFCYIGSLTPAALANGGDWEGYEDGPECSLPRSAAYRADAAPLAVTVRHWDENRTGWQEMMDARKFVDRPPGVAQAAFNDPEELNRRVDIHVLSAGACSAPMATPDAVPVAPASEASTTSQEQIAGLVQ